MATPETTPPHFLGLRDVGDGVAKTLVLAIEFNGVRFSIVAADPDDDAVGHALVPPGYQFEESIEGNFLMELAELTRGPFDLERVRASDRLERQLAALVIDACLPTMQNLAPTPIPAAKTLHDHLHPVVYTLQVLTEGDSLTCHELDSDAIPPEPRRSVSGDKLRAMKLDIETTDIPVIKTSQVILVRHLQSYVWRVTVDGQDLIYKSLVNIFEPSIGKELATYLKLRSAGLKGKLPELKGGFRSEALTRFPLPSPLPCPAPAFSRMALPDVSLTVYPSFLGIVQANEGVIGILLDYIPHKHHSLRALLDGVERGTIAPDEATAALRQKWATQIRDTLAELHSLGILWLDIKTDNVLIDEDGDAVVVDFGGGNTVGWVDRDKYGSMEGEMQGLGKIMVALGVEANSD
jgi:hypothetical protein